MASSLSGLPPELRLLVLEEISKYCNDNKLKRAKAICAAVCREWQAHFERETFRKLVLQRSCLEEFDAIIERRRPRKFKRRKGLFDYRSTIPPIKHIWLRIELKEYDCTVCKYEESQEETTRNNVLFTNTLWKLLTTLSKVGFHNNNTPADGIALELSAHSPSDGRHMFQGYHLIGDDYPYLADNDEQSKHIRKKLQMDRISVKDPFHGLRYGRPIIGSDYQRDRAQQARRLWQPLAFDFRELDKGRRKIKPVRRLPPVRVVTDLKFRRQYHRCLSTASMGQLLEESFPNLSTMWHERWRPKGPQARIRDDSDYGITMGGMPLRPDNFLFYRLPRNLTRLHIFEDSFLIKQTRICRLQLLSSLEAVAPTLEHLSAAFITDAWTCFDDAEAPGLKYQPSFPHLKSLALTSQKYLRSDQGSAKINTLLRKAAISARKMPKLEIMELWSKECFFRYDRTVNALTSKITYASRWEEPNIIDAQTLRAWQMLDFSRVVECELVRLPVGCYAVTGTILRHLKLRGLILDPVSLLQLRLEAGDYGQSEVATYDP